MSTSRVRRVSDLTRNVKDLSRQMADKTARPKWNGDALRKHRKARGWDVEALAEVIGASKGLIYKWENSENTPGADWFVALLIVFDVPAVRFFTGIDEFQGKLKGPALVTKRPIITGGKDTGSKYYSTGGSAATVPRVGAPIPGSKSPAVAATPSSESRRGHRSPKH